MNPFGLHFSLIQPQDLLLVDHAGQVLDESGPDRLLNTAAFAIHSAIHAARPDVLCAAHSHSVYGRAFSTLGKELDMITQDTCAFYKDHAVYRQFNGVVLAEEEGRRITEALGGKKVSLMPPSCSASKIQSSYGIYFESRPSFSRYAFPYLCPSPNAPLTSNRTTASLSLLPQLRPPSTTSSRLRRVVRSSL